MARRKIRIKVPFITRVEGEASLEFDADDDQIDRLHLKIFEPPRLFEQFLIGKNYIDAPELSARICGICPMAYQLTSILAFEKLFQVEIPEPIAQLRRVMNLGEWIQSHALHIHFLALPDFFGFDNALEMAKHHPDAFKRGVRIQALGNDVMALLGGRSVHPIGLKVGGFERLLAHDELNALKSKAEDTRQLAHELVVFCASLKRPDYSYGFDYVSLKSDNCYPINGGRIASASDLIIDVEDYQDYFKEHQEPHSTALYSMLNGQDYLVGPLARFNNNFAQLDDETRQLAVQVGLDGASLNMFDSIVIRALELHYAINEICRLLDSLYLPDEPSVVVTPRAGDCCHATEAPRGLIYHRYKLDEKGRIINCTIIPPTSQNQARIEQDLKHSVQVYGLEHSDEELKLFCEQVIRNYDPCISCSTHFLKLKVNRV
ncbi:Ni/Fe hydrogenase subunit alpha [Photobacterium lipolyticum]|uniref:Ni/Fe hydrogenase subunit alpha n=1 Tax=Photobacterium lipolyticum TaxID=266810 RepID=A0A2T3MWH3_9GAMM|nr:Ni/Fe hydrogenase subunit alpha [Photobacterium lipolyticum]PSW04335.1 Ni/Fe hydrogenase subunit alpha [Photobacterium lipolyticum]